MATGYAGPRDGHLVGAERDALRATFGTRLRAARLTAGYSQQRLADLAEMCRKTIQRFEYGERRPRADTIRLLALVLDRTDPDTLEAELLAAAGESARPAWGGNGGRRRRLTGYIERTGKTRTENREWGRARMAERARNKAEWIRWYTAMASRDIADMAALHGIDYPRGVHFLEPTDLPLMNFDALASQPAPHMR